MTLKHQHHLGELTRSSDSAPDLQSKVRNNHLHKHSHNKCQAYETWRVKWQRTLTLQRNPWNQCACSLDLTTSPELKKKKSQDSFLILLQVLHKAIVPLNNFYICSSYLCNSHHDIYVQVHKYTHSRYIDDWQTDRLYRMDLPQRFRLNIIWWKPWGWSLYMRPEKRKGEGRTVIFYVSAGNSLGCNISLCLESHHVLLL